MKAIVLALCTVLFGSTIQAQVQFWNVSDVEGQAWTKGIKDSKVKQVSLFRTDEHGRKLDSAHADEIRHYNANGQLVETVRFKYSWAIKAWELLLLDSFIYNSNGKLLTYRGYEGPKQKLVYQTSITYNPKQQQTKHDNFTFDYGQPVPDGRQLFTYNPKQQPAKLVGYDAKGKIQFTRLFSYDAKGKLTKATFDNMSNVFSWNDKGQLLSSKEFYGKELQKTITYSYDTKGYRTGSSTTTSYDYQDAVTYTYLNDSPLLKTIYLQYPGSGGKTDTRHEWTVMEYLYY